MAIDLEAIRRKLNQLSGTNSRRNTMWRPQEGEEATVRLMAFSDNDGQPFKERWFYYNIGNNPGLLTPHQFGNPDPIQNLINELRSDGENKGSYELAKKLYPKMRVYAPVIVRGEEDKGVRLWAFGKMVYQSLLNIMLDEDYGDITDPTTGRDIKVVCTKAPGRQWATTEVRPRGKQTKLSSESKQAKEWLSAVPDLDEMYTCKSFEELEGIVNAWLNGTSTDDLNKSEGTERATNTPASSNKSTSTKQYGNIDDAFADLAAEFDDM